MDNIWYKDPGILLNKDRITEIAFGRKEGSTDVNRDVNAMVRAIIIVALILILLTTYVKYILIFALIAIIGITIYFEKTTTAQKFEPTKVTEEPIYVEEAPKIKKMFGDNDYLRPASYSSDFLRDMLGIQRGWQQPFHNHEVPFDELALRDNQMMRAKENQKYGLDNYLRNTNIADLYERNKVNEQIIMAPNYNDHRKHFSYTFDDRRPFSRTY